MIKPHVLPGGSGVRTAAILVAVIAVLYLAREIFIPLAFAITLALVLTPAVAWLQKLRVGRVPSVLFAMLVSIAIACGIGWVIFNQLVEVVNDLPRYQQNIHNKIEAMHTPGKGVLGQAAANVKELGKELSSSSLPTTPQTPSQGGRNTSNQPVRPVPVQIVAEPANEFEYVRDLAKPVLAPLGTAARPNEPSTNDTSTSTVGLPRLSRICRP